MFICLLHPKLHGWAFIFVVLHLSEIKDPLLIRYRRASNPLHLYHEVCTLPLCYNCHPTDVLLETLCLRLTLRLYNHQLEGPDWNSPIASRQQQNQTSCQQHLQFPSSLFPMLLNSSVRMRAGVSNMLDLMAMNLRATMDKLSWNWQKYQILLHNKNNIKQ